MQASLGRVSGLWRQRNSNLVCARVDLYALECSSIESQPQTARRDVHAHAKRVERLHLHPVSFNFHVAPESQPTEIELLSTNGPTDQQVRDEKEALLREFETNSKLNNV